MTVPTTIDEVIEEQRRKGDVLEAKVPQKTATSTLKPVSQRHILQILDRIDPVGLDDPQENVPAIPDIKKAMRDYNSIDYQIIAMNLWKSKAREFF